MQKPTITSKRALLAAIAATIAFLLLTAPHADASAFYVRQCDVVANGNAVPYTVNASFSSSGGFEGVNQCGGGGFAPGLTLFANNGSTQGHSGQFSWAAPSGMDFLGYGATLSFNADNGEVPYFLAGVNGSGYHTTIASGSSGGHFGVGGSLPGGTNLVTMLLACQASGCNASANGFANGYGYVFAVRDLVAPATPSLGGGLVSGGWKNGSYGISASSSDGEAGLQYLDLYVNGSHQSRDDLSSSCASSNGWIDRFRPCPSSSTISRTYATNGTNNFADGANTVTACAYDYTQDGAPNGACNAATVYVDTTAPGAVSGLQVAGGSAWRPTNDFDLSWSNPAQAHAPIDGYYYRITKVGGGYDSGAQYVSGAASSRPDVTVPSAGEYQVKIWLRDAAGNHSEANAQSVTLRYDPTVPPAAEAQFNGWVRRNDFDATADWQEVNPNQLGPSGLDGYAVSVSQDPSSDPCVSDPHPSPVCSAEEINNGGIGDTEMSISHKDEGDWYIHVVPVTGAGVKAPVRHTPMPVDTTDPQSSIAGADGGWTNKDVTLTVNASDPLSGMTPRAADYPMDPQPRTCLRVGSGAAECEPDADITRVVSGEGEQAVSYFARDLAGNENSGQPEPNGKQNNPPGTATVRIDKTAPQLAFAAAQDVNDPAKMVVAASDALSGVASGTVELRKQGSSGSWSGLATSVEGGNLVARVPDDVAPGRYEFRATATDRAGNTGATDRRADGSSAVYELPLKEGVNLSATVGGDAEEPAAGGKKCKGKKAKKKCKCKDKPKRKCKGKGPKVDRAATSVTLPYGKPMRLSGVLRTEGDAPLRGRELVVTERMADGGRPEVRTSTTTTDSNGGYALDLEAGPSRQVIVTFPGDQRYRPTESDPVDALVKGRVLAFNSSRTVPETKSIRFRGRVGAAGVELGSQGKRVELQYEKSPGNWRTIDSGQTNRDGAFKLRYGLRANYLRKTMVRFRIAVPPEGAWPYVGTATSRPRKTVILP